MIGLFCGMSTELVPKRDRGPGVSDAVALSRSYLRTQMLKLPPFCKIPPGVILNHIMKHFV